MLGFGLYAVRLACYRPLMVTCATLMLEEPQHCMFGPARRVLLRLITVLLTGRRAVVTPVPKTADREKPVAYRASHAALRASV